MYHIYDPGIRFRGPPPPEWVGSTQEKGKKQYVSLCGPYMHVHTDTPPHPQGGAGHTIDTHIHTYIQIHTYTHTCMYIQTRPPNPEGGRGKTTCNRPAPPVHIAPRPFGGGGVGWGLQTWTIYICIYQLFDACCSLMPHRSSAWACGGRRLCNAYAGQGLRKSQRLRWQWPMPPASWS